MKFDGLDGRKLKVLAMAAMVVDHVGSVFFRRVRLLRVIGRIAFPIYAFLLVEGFCHTGNRKKYLGRMALFSVLSEVPFDLALFHRFWYPKHQNVFFELLVGRLVLEGLQWAERLRPGKRELFLAGTVTAGCLFAELLKADYGAMGILLIGACYLLRNFPREKLIAAGVISFLDSLDVTYGAGVLAAIPIRLYNGKRGKKGQKAFFYCFYPLHLLLLYAIKCLVTG
jgi:hypothetical protein